VKTKIKCTQFPISFDVTTPPIIATDISPLTFIQTTRFTTTGVGENGVVLYFLYQVFSFYIMHT